MATFIAIDHVLPRLAIRPARLLSVSIAIVALQAVSAATIAPYDLSYFNSLVGGPSQGFRYLADSNVDWGQDLPALRDTLARVGARRPGLSYFGSAPPEAYGVNAEPWPSGNLGSFDWVAISATNLDGVYLDGDPFAAFRDVPPSARAAYSILLYATDRADVQQAISTTSARLRR